MPDQGLEETEVAFQRLREVLSAPDRRGWRRYLRRPGADPDPDKIGAPGASRRASGATPLLAVPLLGAALILMISVVRPGAGAGPRPSDRTVAAAAKEDRAARSAVDATGESTPARPPVGGERVWPAEPIAVEGTIVSIGERRWAVGEVGDVVIVGDWDCDGAPTPAVLRPADGGLYVFDRWAGEGEAATARKIGGFPGAVTAAAAGCGSAIVTSPGGEQRRVDTAATGR